MQSNGSTKRRENRGSLRGVDRLFYLLLHPSLWDFIAALTEASGERKDTLMTYKHPPGVTRDFPFFTIGLTSILVQIIVLRQFMTVSSGNELDMGITLSVWLVAVGIGSYVGHKVGFNRAFATSFLVVAFLVQPTIFFIGQLRSLLPFEFGETIPLTTTILLTLLSLFPICFLLGLQFPLAVSYSGGNPSRVYGFEAAGACIGGALFSLLFSGRFDVYLLSAALSILNLVTALFLLNRKHLWFLILIPFLFYFAGIRVSTVPHWKGAELVDRVESRYGEIAVLKTKDQINVYSSGRFQFAYPDHQIEELKVHLPMSLHPSPKRVLIIGGSVAVLRETLKYPVSAVDFVDLDPKIIAVSLKLLDKEDSKTIQDKRVRTVAGDARMFVKEVRNTGYDLILLNLPEPATANVNRLYSVEFFAEAKALLQEKGIFSLTLPVSYGYIGRRMQVANGSIFKSLKHVFSHVEVSSEEYGYILASESAIDTDPSKLNERFSSRAIKTDYFQPYIFYDAYSPIKAHMVRERLAKAGMLNTDLRPVAYLYNLMVWAEIHGGSALNYLLNLRVQWAAVCVIAIFIILVLALWRKKKTVYFSMFTTGYSTMAFSVVILLAYQALYGYVYEMIGLLASSFMLGTALGSLLIQRVRSPLKSLRFLELLSILLFLTAPLAFRQEALFYGMTFLCGIIGGMQFVTANLCMKGNDVTRVAGRFYAVDLTGSFLGAFTGTLFIIPLYGTISTLFFLAFMKGTSLLLLASIRYEET